jgi:hypothetical protein
VISKWSVGLWCVGELSNIYLSRSGLQCTIGSSLSWPVPAGQGLLGPCSGGGLPAGPSIIVG